MCLPALPCVGILPRDIRLFIARGFVTDVNDLITAYSDVSVPEGDDLHFLSAMGTFLLGHARSLLISFVSLMSCRTKNQFTTDRWRMRCRFNDEKIWVVLPYYEGYPRRDPI